jgi:ERCC4-related helicase
MIFVGRRAHGHQLAKYLAAFGCEALFVHGGSNVYLYRPSGHMQHDVWTIEQIAEYVNSRERCILICTQVLDEGVDIPVINVLIMAAALKKYRRTVQRAGRGMRPKEGQNRVFIFDFWDEGHPYLVKHSDYRKWTYEREEYDFSESLNKTAEVMGCPLVAKKSLLNNIRI